jgi:diacylglycerol kinase (ATP)
MKLDGIRDAIAVINPVAGSGGNLEYWRDFGQYQDFLPRWKDLSWHLILTDHQGHWIQELKDRLHGDRPTIVAAVGGDGTLSTVAQVLKSESSYDRKSLFLFPGGRGNDFIRGTIGYEGSLKEYFSWVNARGWQANAMNFIGLKAYGVKDSSLNPKDFFIFNMASLLYGGAVVEEVQKLKHKTAWTYVWNGAKKFLGSKNHSYMVSDLEGKVLFADSAMAIFVGNSKCNGKGLYWLPKASVFDETIDMVFVRKPPIVEFFTGLEALRKCKPLPFENVNKGFLGTVSLDFNCPVPMEVDGEYCGEFSRYNFFIPKDRTQIWVPSPMP